jgi:hypothetical protein
MFCTVEQDIFLQNRANPAPKPGGINHVEVDTIGTDASAFRNKRRWTKRVSVRLPDPEGPTMPTTWPWPAPGSEDTELRCLMEQEAGHGEATVYAGVQG